MNLSTAEAVDLADQIVAGVKDLKERQVMIAPVFTALAEVAKVVRGTNVALAAQNLYWKPSGAFTGEISAPMLIDAGCSHVIVGHSERRQFFAETDYTVAKKIGAAHSYGLIPVLCVGESLEERQAGEAMEVVETQIRHGLVELPAEGMETLIVAYEPVWAIGTGQVASVEEAEEIHAHIRTVLASVMPDNKAEDVRILYGGSVKPENISALMACPNIDGALVGGASLKPESFVGIARYEES